MIRIGSGYDLHAFDKESHNQTIKLCGVLVPCKFKIKAHSDGDLALHAITDALLGAVAKGSIGSYFPPDDERWKGADSSIFLDFAYQEVLSQGYRLGNLDITFITEEPKIMPHAQAMKNFLIQKMKTTNENINIKAVTSEKIGALGRLEGIAVQVALLIVKF